MFYEMFADCAETITNTHLSVSHPRRIICLCILDHLCSKTIEALSASEQIQIFKYSFHNIQYMQIKYIFCSYEVISDIESLPTTAKPEVR